jgi:NAD-dependent SIR2 family protein deacetylase
MTERTPYSRVTDRFDDSIEVIEDGIDPIEYFDEEEVVKQKAKQLAEMLRRAKHAVIYTGAGVSTSAGIPDFRGPNGVWTMHDEGRAYETTFAPYLLPTPAHMAILELAERDIIKYVTSTNCDGLHLRSGLPYDKLSEIHGNIYHEVCSVCSHLYERDHDTSDMYNYDVHRHETGRMCEQDGCLGELLDTIVNFGENELEVPWNNAEKNAKQCDLAIVLGSSLRVHRSCDLPPMCFETNETKTEPGKLVIVNLQKTPQDDTSCLRVHAKTDMFMELVMNELGLVIPDWMFERTIEVSVKHVSAQLFGKSVQKRRLFIKDADPNGHIGLLLRQATGAIEYKSDDDEEFTFHDDPMEPLYHTLHSHDDIKSIKAWLLFSFREKLDCDNTAMLNIQHTVVDQPQRFLVRCNGTTQQIMVTQLE